jgi:hypothetical protein
MPLSAYAPLPNHTPLPNHAAPESPIEVMGWQPCLQQCRQRASTALARGTQPLQSRQAGSTLGALCCKSCEGQAAAPSDNGCSQSLSWGGHLRAARWCSTATTRGRRGGPGPERTWSGQRAATFEALGRCCESAALSWASSDGWAGCDWSALPCRPHWHTACVQTEHASSVRLGGGQGGRAARQPTCSLCAKMDA